VHLELRGITKVFPGVVANDDINLEIIEGRILGLLGENGAGKSTLMNILYGLYAQTSGEILIDGTPVSFESPSDAIAAGIGMVHQHFMLVPVFTVTENVILGVEPTGSGGRIDYAQGARRIAEISETYNLAVDPSALIEQLPVGVQQRVEIIKVLFRHANVVIFDEPTAVLTPQEVSEFYRIVRQLRDDGKSVVFITHKLKEVLELADDIAVLRRGRIVHTSGPGEHTEQELAEIMVGRAVELVVAKTEAEPGENVLEVRDLVVRDDRNQVVVDHVGFNVRSGEIVGLAGVQGNGQSRLVEALTGLRRSADGSIHLAGDDVTDLSPRDRHRLGIAHIPEDRQKGGLILDFSVAENAVLDTYYDERYSRGLRMDWEAAEADTTMLVEQFDVRTPDIHTPAGSLSGGNQQKIVVGREFNRDFALCIASQPTRGVDVGSIEFIHEQLIAKRDLGAGLLLVSTELDEIIALSDRILVMFAGKIVAEFLPAETDHTKLGLAMAGAYRGEAAP